MSENTPVPDIQAARTEDQESRTGLQQLCEESADPFCSESNKAAIMESIRQIEQGKTVIKTLDELESMTKE